MDGRLYEAALRGDVKMLNEVLKEDASIVNQVIVDGVAKETPLHVAAHCGHVDFVREISIKKPELARILNSQEVCPLHLASEKGHLQVVKELLHVDSNVCFIRDRDGMTPLQIAAMKGRIKIMEELIHAKPIAAWVLTHQRDPILHVCAKHGRYKILEKLIDLVTEEESVRVDEFVNLKDRDDNTILHLLAAKGPSKVIKSCIMAGVDTNAMNVDGCTALDISLKNRRGRASRVLMEAGATTEEQMTNCSQQQKFRLKMLNRNWSEIAKKMETGLLLMASLIATVTFQAMVNPPGGVWPENGFHNRTIIGFKTHSEPKISPTPTLHIAGQAIMAYVAPGPYMFFQIFNTLGFTASVYLMVVIMIQVKRPNSFHWALFIGSGMFLTIIAFVTAYCSAFQLLHPKAVFRNGFRTHWLPLTIASTMIGLSMFLPFGVILGRSTRFHRLMNWFGKKSRSYKINRTINSTHFRDGVAISVEPNP